MMDKQKKIKTLPLNWVKEIIISNWIRLKMNILIIALENLKWQMKHKLI